MTLIVGVKCSDGIVLGSDGAATFGGLQGYTARQPTRKLHIIDESVVVGVSGFVGLGQRLIEEIARHWTNLKPKQSSQSPAFQRPSELKKNIAEQFRKVVMPEFEVAKVTRHVLGDQHATSSVVCNSLVAIPWGPGRDELCLLSFDHQCAPEECTDELPFVAIGGGQQIADPFLALLRRVFWEDRHLTVADGIFATCWTLKHAIETNTGGVSEPTQIVTVRLEGTRMVARELSEEEKIESYEAVSSAEDTLRRWRNDQISSAGAASEPPSPPQ